MTERAATELRNELSARRRELRQDVRESLRAQRSDRPDDVRDSVEHSDDESQGSLDLALLGMRAETLTRVDEALIRIDAGQYGACVACEGPISVRRLRALPFAVRCRECQARHEAAQYQEREQGARHNPAPRFSQSVG